MELTQRQKTLLRQALGPLKTSSRVLLAAQAADELIREHKLTSRELEARLELIATDPFQSWQGARAAKMASRLLLVVNGDAPPEEPGVWRPNFMLDEFGEEDRLAWLRIELLPLMVDALDLKWPDVVLYPQAHVDDAEVRWVFAEQEAIVGAAEPLEAAREWLCDPPRPPARKPF